VNFIMAEEQIKQEQEPESTPLADFVKLPF
jgi:hypothetical protein